MSQLHFTEAAVSVRADEAGQAVRDASVSGMFPGLVGGIPSFSATMGPTTFSSIASFANVRAWACARSTAFAPTPTIF